MENKINAVSNVWNQIINNPFLKWENLSVSQKEIIIKEFDEYDDISYDTIKLKLALFVMGILC